MSVTRRVKQRQCSSGTAPRAYVDSYPSHHGLWDHIVQLHPDASEQGDGRAPTQTNED